MPIWRELLLQEPHHRVGVEDRLGLLEQEGLVGAAAALGDEHELVGVVAVGVQLDLRGKVRAGVLLVPHRERRHLAVAQVEVAVGLPDAAGEVLLVAAVGEDVAPALAHDDRRAGVLAHRQDHPGGDVGVLEQVHRHEAVVAAGLGVVEDRAQLGEVRGAQVVGDVLDGLGRELRQDLGLHGEEPPPGGFDRVHPVLGEQAVLGGVGADGKQVGIAELRCHAFQLSAQCARRICEAALIRCRASDCRTRTVASHPGGAAMPYHL